MTDDVSVRRAIRRLQLDLGLVLDDLEALYDQLDKIAEGDDLDVD